MLFECVMQQNSLPRAVVKAPKSSHITPILKSFQWLKVNERTEYKLLSLTYKVLTTSQFSCLNNLISVQPPRSTRSSSIVTLSRPPTISSLKTTDRSFRYASPRLWNQLPDSFRQTRQSRLDSRKLEVHLFPVTNALRVRIGNHFTIINATNQVQTIIDHDLSHRSSTRMEVLRSTMNSQCSRLNRCMAHMDSPHLKQKDLSIYTKQKPKIKK